MCFIECLKPCRAPHELGELWNVEYELMEEGYPDGVEQRGIDPGHDVVQVFADPLELKTSESGEDGACWRRWTSAFPWSGRDRRDSNSMVRDLRLANTARLVTIASGEKYPE